MKSKPELTAGNKKLLEQLEAVLYIIFNQDSHRGAEGWMSSLPGALYSIDGGKTFTVLSFEPQNGEQRIFGNSLPNATFGAELLNLEGNTWETFNDDDGQIILSLWYKHNKPWLNFTDKVSYTGRVASLFNIPSPNRLPGPHRGVIAARSV